MSSLQNAVIRVYRGKPSDPETISCLFNPAEYKITESAGYTEKGERGKNRSSRQFVGGRRASLSLSLYYDVTENMGGLSAEEKGRDVLDYVAEISELLKIEGNLHRPPEIEFAWGGFSFRGVLSSLNTEYSYFAVSGKPLRAKLDLTIDRVPPQTEDKKNPNQSPDRSKYRVVTEGMSLWKLAWEEYGDCEKWKEIARYNNLENPLDIRPGQELGLPALTDGE
ncbi:hypothetical protein [Clostridium sp. AN503]|uniref:CIS tube protein n=1 Tax=Clostridium sp. AN503 TaxID=3160598 RepID=UPI00345B313C